MSNRFATALSFIAGAATAILGVRVNAHLGDSPFWCVLDFLFWPITWVKWLVLHQVNMTTIREAFSFFLA